MKAGLVLLLALVPTLAVAQTLRPLLPSHDDVMAVVAREASAEIARHPAPSAVFLAAAARLEAPDVRAYAVRTATGKIAFGDVDETLYAHDGRPETLQPLRRQLDATLAELDRPSKRPPWGCEAVALTPAVYARMSVLTQDPKYLLAMDSAWQRMSRDLSRAHGRHACGGGKAVDVNTDGSALAGLARILEVMPADFPARPRYVAQYQAMAAALIALKDAKGQWRPSLLATAVYLPDQTPGVAMTTYALAFGLNHSLLDRQTYLPPVLSAWAGLNRDIGPDGGIGGGADSSGAFILAGLEITRLDDPATPLPSPVIVHATDAMPPQAEHPAVDASNNLRSKGPRPATRAVAPNPVTDDPSERALSSLASPR